MPPEWWRRSPFFDWKDDEARERARRGLIIVAVAAIMFGGLAAFVRIGEARADDRAAELEQRLRDAVAQTPYEELVPMQENEALSRRVGRLVTVLPRGGRLAVSAGVDAWSESRCVTVLTDGSGTLSSSVSGRVC